MDVLVTPRALAGTVTVPASKSDVHRALICAALSHEPTTISSDKAELVTVSHDIHATGHCLRMLGATFDYAEDRITVHPIPRASLPRPHVELDSQSSGSTVRFMLPVASVLAQGATFVGSEQLAARPLGDLMVAMHEHGARFCSAKRCARGNTMGPLTAGGERANLRNLSLPIRMMGHIEPGDYEIPGDVSSQYVTGLLFALSLMSDLGQGESTLALTGRLESAGYVDMTIEWLARFGMAVEPELGGWSIPAGQRFSTPGTVRVEGDWSNGAVLLGLAAFNEGVKVKGLKASSQQPDRIIERLLPEWRTRRENRVVDVRDSPDLFPLLALLAGAPVELRAGQDAPVTRFVGIDRLRFKESNRVATTAKALMAAGIHVEVSSESCSVQALAGTPSGKLIEVDSADDHRIVMAATLAAHVFGCPVLIHGAEAVNKSYPVFFDDYRHLGGSAVEA